ncbi:recombinase family protein [Emcibacter nanhaiensis]|uniref:Recombinase family protein n=2 Tax=Emcibacter nanhaiensis TaxID=1505037 RepID=A0A501PGX1_9PROT|nr:recombinase family protein [Emcibacter nanhaiensis]
MTTNNSAANTVAIYARYSSDNQREASIEDQVRLCREAAAREGWTITKTYQDSAVSGASLMRPGIQALMEDALKGKFSIILTEALDRLSRDQEDIAGLYKRMSFADVRIITLSEGEVNNLHIGLKGTMNALYLKDLADKTRRGLRGRIEQGKSGGGLTYGYEVRRSLDAEGNKVTGERKINPKEAAVVRRIFKDFSAGHSPRAIAKALNQEGVPGPRGSGWGQSTINGNRERGTGIINNELYIGRLVWNRLRYIKDPDTGKRISRLNPEQDWVIQQVPELRIIDQDLWDKVKEQQGALKHRKPLQADNELGRYKRPQYLFSGLLKCGTCGGGFSMFSKTHLACSNRRNKGTCDNKHSIRRDHLEEVVLDGLKNHLMEPAYFAEFCKEYTEELNRLRLEMSASLTAQRQELVRIDKEQDKLVDAICAGVPAAKVKGRMIELETRREELEALLAEAKEPAPLLHPNMAKTYAKKLDDLMQTLNEPDLRAQASQTLRSLIEAVRLVPEGEGLGIELVGDLAGILHFVEPKDKARPQKGSAAQGSISDGSGRRQLPLVAGAGFEPATFRL